MSALIAVMLGAAIGAPLRAALERLVNQRIAPARFPLALSIVNILGSFLAGIALGTTTGHVRTFLIVGIAGSFTTFSGWVQVIHQTRNAGSELGRARSFFWVIGVGAGVLAICVLAAWLGMNFG